MNQEICANDVLPLGDMIEVELTAKSYGAGTLDLPVPDGTYLLALPTGEIVEAEFHSGSTKSIALFIWDRLAPDSLVRVVPNHGGVARLAVVSAHAPAPAPRIRLSAELVTAEELAVEACRIALTRMGSPVSFELAWAYAAVLNVPLGPGDLAEIIASQFFMDDDGQIWNETPSETQWGAGWESVEKAFWRLSETVEPPLLTRAAAKRRSTKYDGMEWHLDEMRHRLLTAEEERLLGLAIAAGQDAAVALKQASTTQEKRELGLLIREADLARERFASHNLRLAFDLAARRARRGGLGTLEIADLVQAGYLGLLRAVEKFDPASGFKFSTYATWWIRQSIERAIADQSRTIRIPVHKHDKIAILERALGNSRDLTIEGLADQTGLTAAEIVDLASVSRAVPLDLLGEDSEVDHAHDPLSLLVNSSATSIYREAIETLAERDREILLRRFGFKDGRCHTLDEIGASFRLTRERIRQLQTKALALVALELSRRGLIVHDKGDESVAGLQEPTAIPAQISERKHVHTSGEESVD